LGITATYLEHEPYRAKAELIEQFLKEIRTLMDNRFVYNTDDENIMFDLLTIQMNEKGIVPYYKC